MLNDSLDNLFAGEAGPVDITIDDHGSILIFRGTSPTGKDWISEHLPADAMRWAGGIVVEPRYAGAIIDGAINDGLEVA